MYFVFNPDSFALGLAFGVLGLVLLLSLVVSYAYNERTLLFLAAYLSVAVALLLVNAYQLRGASLIPRLLLVLGPALVSSLLMWLFRKRTTGSFDKLVILVVMSASLGLLGFYSANDAGLNAEGRVTSRAIWLGLAWSALLCAGFVYRSIQALETAGPWKWWLMLGHAAGLMVALVFLTDVGRASAAHWPVVLMLLVQAPPIYLALVWRSRLLNEIRLRSAAADVIDPLTGLATASVLVERLMRVSARVQSAKPGVAGDVIFLIQVQNWNGLLNELGPEFNEKLLLEAALRLRRAIGDNDLAVRISGGRFAVVAQGLASQAEVTTISTRMVVSGLRIDSPQLPGIEFQFRIIVRNLRLAKPLTLPAAEAWLAALADHFNNWPSSHRTRSIWVLEDSADQSAIFVPGTSN